MTLGVGTWGGSIISENVTAKHLMNIKTLAFETNPINKGGSVNSLGSSQVGPAFGGEGSFIQQIEDRLRARAGNPSIIKENAKNMGSFNKGSKEEKLGSGISESDIQRIIKEFKS